MLSRLEGAIVLSYKDRMHPQVSKAEIEVFKALSAKGLTGGMVTQKPIILKSTIPDFCWLNKRKAVYLDGKQVHSSDKQKDRDEEVVELMEAKGWKVMRIEYEAPLSKKELIKTIEKIKEFIDPTDEY